MNTINQEFEVYIGRIHPKGCPPVQHVETKQAFMSGAAVALVMLIEATETMSEDEAAKIASGILEDARAFLAARVRLFKETGQG